MLLSTAYKELGIKTDCEERMPVAYTPRDDLKGRKFLWVMPDISGMASQDAFALCKTKWNLTWNMIRGYEPECVIAYSGIKPMKFADILLLEDVLNANVQLLDSVECLDDPEFGKYAANPTVYLWLSALPKLNDTWVRLTDVEGYATQMQSGIMLIEDMMTGGLILSKKLEHVFDRLEWKSTEVVLVLGDNMSDGDMSAIELLVLAQKVAAVITCDEDYWHYGEEIPITCVSSVLDPFGIDLMWRELKRRKHSRHTYVFMGSWQYDERQPHAKTLDKFAKYEKELPASACLYDAEAWSSLHPGCTADPSMRVIMNAKVVFENFVNHDNMKLVIKEGDGGDEGNNHDDNDKDNGGCDCE